MSKETMKLALEALEYHTAIKHPQQIHYRDAAIAALKEALAQPEQEPVAWMVYTLDGTSVCVTDNPADFTPEHRALPLYTTPPQRTEPVCPECKAGVLYECVACSSNNYPPQRTWAGLSDEEIQEAGRFSYCRGGTSEKLYHIMWNSQPSACIGWSREELIAFTKAVEAKYQEKNQ